MGLAKHPPGQEPTEPPEQYYHYYCNYDCCELTSACFTSAPRLAARGGSAGGG